jgi:ornithine decarboxylase
MEPPRKPENKRFADARSMVAALQPSYPVYCLEPATLMDAAQRFIDLFPGRVLYAVKCNPHPRVLKALWAGGIRHFDTASLPEIGMVRELFREAGIYFMHPVKGRAVIKTAWRVFGVDDFIVDHPDELAKVLDETDGGDGITLYVRLKTPQVEGTFYHLSDKFGAEPDLAAELLREAHEQGCQTGLAFHVGSQCGDPGAYASALEMVGQVMDKARVDLNALDVGGGFPGYYADTQAPPIEDFIETIEAGVRRLKLRRDCVLMCQPGRALVADGCNLVVQVQLRKENQLYINDGIYGSLSETVDAGVQYRARLIRLTGEPSTELVPFVMNGPTCDSLDVLPKPFHLPADTREGDWIEIEQTGAYSNALASHFNGFHPETFVEIAPEAGTRQP